MQIYSLLIHKRKIGKKMMICLNNCLQRILNCWEIEQIVSFIDKILGLKILFTARWVSVRFRLRAQMTLGLIPESHFSFSPRSISSMQSISSCRELWAHWKSLKSILQSFFIPLRIMPPIQFLYFTDYLNFNNLIL